MLRAIVYEGWRPRWVLRASAFLVVVSFMGYGCGGATLATVGAALKPVATFTCAAARELAAACDRHTAGASSGGEERPCAEPVSSP